MLKCHPPPYQCYLDVTAGYQKIFIDQNCHFGEAYQIASPLNCFHVAICHIVAPFISEGTIYFKIKERKIK